MSFKVNRDTIYLTRGDTFMANLTIHNSDGSIYIPEEGDSIRFALKENIEDEECIIWREIPTDTMLLILYPGDTKDLEYGTYVYDIQLITHVDDIEIVDTFITASKFKLTEEVE